MPGWHAKTKKLLAEGKVQVAGIIQEQHPDRCRLFMQWHRMSWPIMVDSLNLLGTSAVPMTFLIDQHGVIRHGPRSKPKDLAAFLNTEYPPPKPAVWPRRVAETPDRSAQIRTLDAKDDKTAADWTTLGDVHFLRGKSADFGAAADAYQKAVKLGGPAPAQFRLGVAIRRRYESGLRRNGDFQASLNAWKAALDRKPNQYIWRRRIQQYGPRLDKPYPFYTWVQRARKEITARGETPVKLAVEPSGAELAGRSDRFRASKAEIKDPDPTGRIFRDTKPYINLEIAVAPATYKKQRAVRAHIVMTPNERAKGHWNNQAQPLLVWLNPPEGVQVDRRHLSAPNARQVESTEVRRVEFEAHYVKDMKGKQVRIPGYVLYYVCEDVNGVCMYLRQDFQVIVPFR